MASDRQVKLSAVNAPSTPPVPLTAKDLVTLRGLVASVQRRSEKQAAKNVASGFVEELPGADADAIRAITMKALHDKLEAWLDDTWPLVDAAEAALNAAEDAADDDPDDEIREEWIIRSREKGLRLAQVDGEEEPDDPNVVEGEGETVGEARWRARRELHDRFGSVPEDDIEFVVLSEGVRGMLGVGQEPARVLARIAVPRAS